MTLPDDIIAIIHSFADSEGRNRRKFAHAMIEFMDEVPHGGKMTVYNMIADEWTKISGTPVKGRTIRLWVASVRELTSKQLIKYLPLNNAQLIESFNLAEIAKVDAATILDWCIEKDVFSVPKMQAHWLPLTGDQEHTDPPALTRLVLWIGKRYTDSPHKARIDELITELRRLLQ